MTRLIRRLDFWLERRRVAKIPEVVSTIGNRLDEYTLTQGRWI